MALRKAARSGSPRGCSCGGGTSCSTGLPRRVIEMPRPRCAALMSLAICAPASLTLTGSTITFLVLYTLSVPLPQCFYTLLSYNLANFCASHTIFGGIACPTPVQRNVSPNAAAPRLIAECGYGKRASNSLAAFITGKAHQGNCGGLQTRCA